MLFGKAFELMKKGRKVKLPSWGGYWYWDAEKKTIVIHTKDGEELDIRQMECPEYTFDNIASDEWQIADEKNCPELGGVNTFSFGEAIKYMKRGMKVARIGSAAFTAECNNFSIHAIMKAPGGYHEATSISHAIETG